MVAVAVTNTFVDGNTIFAAGENTNFSDLVTYINNRNNGSVGWDAVYSITATTVAGIFDNSSGTSNIIQAKDNGTIVFLVADGGNVGIGAAAPDAKLEIEGSVVDIHQDGSGSVYHNIDRGTTSSEALVVFQTAGVNKCAVGMDNDTTDLLYFFTGGDLGVPKMSIDANGALVFNDAGTAVADFRMESDSSANMFLMKASSDQIFFGGATTASGTLTFLAGGGLQVGVPTGGDKGSGTVNLQSDIYRNNTQYTNPDYVFEKWVTGTIEKFKDNAGASTYEGLLSLDNLETYVREKLDLPGVKTQHVDESGGQGIFARADVILEKVEEIFIHLIEMNKRLKVLETTCQ